VRERNLVLVSVVEGGSHPRIWATTPRLGGDWRAVAW
jgi:hypothetical protein